MGFLEFGVFCLITLAIAWFLNWLLNTFIPSHPAVVNQIIWGLAILIIILKLAAAVGILGHDVQIPHL